MWYYVQRKVGRRGSQAAARNSRDMRQNEPRTHNLHILCSLHLRPFPRSHSCPIPSADAIGIQMPELLTGQIGNHEFSYVCGYWIENGSDSIVDGEMARVPFPYSKR